MVHALQEARRVLVPRGIFIDLRPICIDAPLEIMTSTGCAFAGFVDQSPNIPDDIAADNAIQVILRDNLFKEMQVDYFDFAYYWNTVTEMKAFMDDNWKDDIILPDGVLQQVHLLFDQNRDQGRVRLRIRKRLAKFEKQ